MIHAGGYQCSTVMQKEGEDIAAKAADCHQQDSDNAIPWTDIVNGFAPALCIDDIDDIGLTDEADTHKNSAAIT